MNPTGIKPVELKVLILVDEVKDRSSGGIYLSDQTREREQYAHDRGIIVDMSEMAFYDWKGLKPKLGDKVLFDKYAGTMIQFRKDKEMQRYRLCNDKNIAAIIEE